jgi:hypothetical protein
VPSHISIGVVEVADAHNQFLPVMKEMREELSPSVSTLNPDGLPGAIRETLCGAKTEPRLRTGPGLFVSGDGGDPSIVDGARTVESVERIAHPLEGGVTCFVADPQTAAVGFANKTASVVRVAASEAIQIDRKIPV